MTRVVSVAALTVAAACATAPGRVAMPTNVDRPFVAGYHAYWTGDAWTGYPMDALDELFFFEIELAGDGTILDGHGWPGAWRAMAEKARDAGVQVAPTLSMHDPAAFEALFADAARVERLVETVLSLLADSPGVSGVHLDVEVFRRVSIDARDGYTAFVARLAAQMRALHPRLALSVFVLAFDDDDVYNERALGQIADYVVVQGYDYHGVTSPSAGPVGALRGWDRLNWQSVLARFDDFGVPRRKIVMSVPLYGYEWPVDSAEPGATALGPGVVVPYRASPDVLPDAPRAREQARRHGIFRDGVSGSPYYVFEDADGWRQGWFEDAESLRLKYDFARVQGLGGVALFPLAYGDEEVWEDLRRELGAGR